MTYKGNLEHLNMKKISKTTEFGVVLGGFLEVFGGNEGGFGGNVIQQ